MYDCSSRRLPLVRFLIIFYRSIGTEHFEFGSHLILSSMFTEKLLRNEYLLATCALRALHELFILASEIFCCSGLHTLPFCSVRASCSMHIYQGESLSTPIRHRTLRTYRDSERDGGETHMRGTRLPHARASAYSPVARQSTVCGIIFIKVVKAHCIIIQARHGWREKRSW